MKTQEAQTVINDARHLREWIRRRAGAFGGHAYAVKVVAGTKAPTLEGHSWHYSKVGYYMEYHASTRRIEVGLLWLKSHRPRTFSHATVWDHILDEVA